MECFYLLLNKNQEPDFFHDRNIRFVSGCCSFTGTMKWMTIVILASLLFFIGCTNTTAENHKDLDENMLDLMMYHDNLGLYLRMEKKDYALWLLNGLDSSLQVISSKFEQHRKLKEPFEQSYKKRFSRLFKI